MDGVRTHLYLYPPDSAGDAWKGAIILTNGEDSYTPIAQAVKKGLYTDN